MILQPAASDSSSAINQICTLRYTLSVTETRIADFIIEHPAALVSLNAQQVAERSGTSPATVSRFVRHMGFRSFADLKLAFAREDSQTDGSVSQPLEKVTLENTAKSIEFISRIKKLELDDTANELDPEVVTNVVRAILGARQVLFAALGNSRPVCASTAFMFAQIGINANCPDNVEKASLDSLLLGTGDVVIVVSLSGHSKRLDAIERNAHDAGAVVVCITNNPAAALATDADYCLKTATRDRAITDQQAFSHGAALFVLDIIYLLLFSERRELRERSTRFWNDLSDERGISSPFSS